MANTAPKRAGRPPFKDRSQVRRQVGLKMTDAEKKLVVKKARRAKLSLSAFIRMRALAD